MNQCHLMGKIICIDKFKFIYRRKTKYKAVITLKIQLISGEIINLRAYDKVVDIILRNEFKYVYIYGILRTKGYVQIEEIEKI